MYYPKSQIKTNLYSNAELTVLSSGKTYTGDYWSTSGGKFFAGKTPSDPKSYIELVKTSNNTVLFPQAEPPAEDESNLTYIASNLNVLEYTAIKNIDLGEKLPQVPHFNASLPTRQNYLDGEFTRYFCKRINTSEFIEISEKNFQKLSDRDKALDWKLYTPFKLNWTLSGTPQSIANENRTAIHYLEVNDGFVGLGHYLKYNYTLYAQLALGIVSSGPKRVYLDNGIELPQNLPLSYQLGNQSFSNNKKCANCLFYQQGLCKKWNASIRNEYWCEAWKGNPKTPYENSTLPTLSPPKK